MVARRSVARNHPAIKDHPDRGGPFHDFLVLFRHTGTPKKFSYAQKDVKSALVLEDIDKFKSFYS